MMLRNSFNAIFAVAAVLSAAPALAQTAPAPAAGTPAPAAGTPAPDQQQAKPNPQGPKEVATIGDWTLRCFDVKSIAPCDIIQIVVTKDKQQAVLTTSIVYVPSQSAYLAQIITPLGVSLAKGMTLKAGDINLEGIKYRHCEDNGCYVEVSIVPDVIDGLSKAKSGMLGFIPYNGAKAVAMPLSLDGFSDAIARLKTEATAKAVAPPAAKTATPAKK